jgi:hypothetical protein
LAAEVFPLATSYPASQAFGFSKEFNSPSLKVFLQPDEGQCSITGQQSRRALSGIKGSWLA